MTHALVRTNAKGQPFRGRCIKCGEGDLPMSAGARDCPEDAMVSDEKALLAILDAEDKPDA